MLPHCYVGAESTALQLTREPIPQLIIVSIQPFLHPPRLEPMKVSHRANIHGRVKDTVTKSTRFWTLFPKPPLNQGCTESSLLLVLCEPFLVQPGSVGASGRLGGRRHFPC